VGIDVTSTIERGGEGLIRLLTFCVYMQKFDLIFTSLVKNYQLLPNDVKATALYDEFLDTNAPLTLSISRVEKSSDWHLNQTIEKICTAQVVSNQSIDPETEDPRAHVRHLPARNIFDRLLETISSNSSQFLFVEEELNLALSAVENLPGGKLSPSQIYFTEHIWKPSRQRLSVAGFFTISNIGG